MTREPEVLNTQEAAIFLGVHVETIRRLARCGEIPSFKVGKDWRFRKEALLRWIEEQSKEVDEAAATYCSVVVIDDEEQVCKALARIATRVGCRARWATSGEMGLDLVAEEEPDLVLLDLVMPGMNGPLVLEQIRKTHPDLPVVIVTGYPDSDLMKQATQFAPLMLLAKPVDADLLERTVRIAVGGTMSDERRAGRSGLLSDGTRGTIL